STPPLARRRLRGYSTRLETHEASASSAASASSPSALSLSCVPPVAPNASTARMLFASADLPFTPTVTRDWNRIAVLTKFAAGRACSATAPGSATWISECAGTACLLGRASDGVQLHPGRRRHRRGDRAFHERRVGKADMA